ncbi:MAG: polyphosphate polymerase domain-containing protein [Ruminococcaceae bacterium]|nr:polyphosphate polymerase domain-containing protein [Oscillospiraceae bacterium]
MIWRHDIQAVPCNEVWRHEDKFLIDEVNFFQLYWKLRPFMEVDANAVVPIDSMLPPENQFPGYQVRSLYFDTPERHALFEKLAGFDRRAKYRIRIYNGTDTVITLEKKIKRNSYCRKEKTSLTRPQMEALIAGDYDWLPQIGPLGEELYIEMRTRLMKPLVLVDYHRIPLIWPVDEIRITFDRHLSSGLFRTDIFEDSASVHPVLAPGQVILEVKYNHFLPDFLRCLLSGPRNASLAVSKYAMCSRDITMSAWGDPQDVWEQDWTYPVKENK